MSIVYRYLRPALQWMLLLASLAWTLWFVYAGFGNHMDPLYWLHKYQHLDGGWMSAGSLLFGHLCVRLFGAKLLSLRLVGWGLTVLAIALPYCLLLSPRQRQDHLHWLALAYWMMGYGAFQELSPGTLTVFLLSMIALTAVRYRQQPTLLRGVVIGLLTGLAIAVRFPNILVVIPLAVLFYMVLRIVGKDNLQGGIAVIASAFIATIAAAGVIYGLSMDMLSWSTVDPSMGGTHGLSKMIENLWSKGALLLGFAALWYGILAIGRRSWHWTIPIAVGVGYFTFYFFGKQWYNTDLTYCLSAACIVLSLASRRQTLLWFTALLSVATLGTDVAWLKLFPAVLVLVPLLPTAYAAKMRTYLFLVLVGFTSVQSGRFCHSSIGNSDLTTSTVSASVAPYQGLYIDSANNARIAQLQADGERYSRQDSILAVGQDLHLIRSVTNCQAGYYNEFWSNIFDSVYTAKYEPQIVRRQPVIFCAYSPHFKTKPQYRDRYSAFEQMLQRNGYTPVDRSKYQYMIYIHR